MSKLTLSILIQEFEKQHKDFSFEKVTPDIRENIINELKESTEWTLKDWLASPSGRWYLFSNGFSREISISTEPNGVIYCFF